MRGDGRTSVSKVGSRLTPVLGILTLGLKVRMRPTAKLRPAAPCRLLR